MVLILKGGYFCRKCGNVVETDIGTRENVYRFLKDLNEFLCENFDYLPLEVTEKD